MNLEPAPRLPKWIFLVIDLGLLLTAFIIVYFAKNPYAPVPLMTTVACVGLAAVVGLVPFLIDYAADSAEYVQQERARIADQVQRLNAASESLARAAAQIKAVEEAVHKTAHAAENLPYRMQEKLAEFNQQLATTEDEEKERLTEELATLRQGESERLTALADKISQTVAELTALDASTRKQLAAAQDATAGKFESRLQAAVTALDAKLATLTVSVVTAPAEAAASPSVALAKEGPVASVVESVSVMEASPAPDAGVEPKPKKPRAPRKSKPEDTLAAMSAPAAEGSESPDESASPDASTETATAPADETSVSADGATRLLVTAYIGIGNKLYIRGDGPGLSWDKGVPMKFVSIGKWGWATDEATGPVACKLYKNDETAALSGEVFLEPGQHVEVTALF
jgi:DNA-directed RNA polymerase subunit F